jgi:hypothetical protein
MPVEVCKRAGKSVAAVVIVGVGTTLAASVVRVEPARVVAV